MAGRSETGLDCHMGWGDVVCMSSHKQYQVIDVFFFFVMCTTMSTVTVIQNWTARRCSFPRSVASLKFSLCFMPIISGHFLERPMIISFQLKIQGYIYILAFDSLFDLLSPSVEHTGAFVEPSRRSLASCHPCYVFCWSRIQISAWRAITVM